MYIRVLDRTFGYSEKVVSQYSLQKKTTHSQVVRQKITRLFLECGHVIEKRGHTGQDKVMKCSKCEK